MSAKSDSIKHASLQVRAGYGGRKNEKVDENKEEKRGKERRR